MALGWLYDHIFDDGDYTPKEMLTDAVVGMLGGSLLRPVVTALRRGGRVARHYVDDAARLSSTYLDDLIAWGWVFSPFARPAAATAIGYAAVDHVYDTYLSQSSASSSSSYQQNGGAGDTYKIPGSPSKFTGAFKDGHNDKWRGVTQEWIRNPCRKGFRPDKIKGAWVCRRGSWSSYIRDLKAGRL